MVARLPICAVALTLALAAPTRAASHSAPSLGPRPSPAAEAAVSPLVLDLVVRDKKGVPIGDLRAEEVELYEDGVKRAFEAFQHEAVF